jgi:hypothetical protein
MDTYHCWQHVGIGTFIDLMVNDMEVDDGLKGPITLTEDCEVTLH